MNSGEEISEVYNSSFPRSSPTTTDSAITTTSQDTGTFVLPVAESAFWTPVNITCIFIGVIGIIGNLFSCLIIVCYPPLRKRVTNYFIVNQCFLDLVTALVLMLNIILEYKLRRATGPSLYAACYLIYSRVIFTSVFAASIWNLAALAIERYLKIVHAIRHKTSVTKTKIIITCIGVWVFAFLYRSIAVLPLVSVIGSVCRVPAFKSTSAKTVFGLAMPLGDFFLPMCTIAFCYVQLTRKLRRVNETSTASSSMTSGARRNIIRLLVIVSVVFLLTVGPRQMMALYYTLSGQVLDINSLQYLICLCLNYANCSLNPIIYVFKYDDFRQGVKSLIRYGNRSSVSLDLRLQTSGTSDVSQRQLRSV